MVTHFNITFPTLKRRNNFLAKLVDLSTFCAVPGCPSLRNFAPYCIALHILSLASALFKYNTASASSARATSKVLILDTDEENTCKESWSILQSSWKRHISKKIYEKKNKISVIELEHSQGFCGVPINRLVRNGGGGIQNDRNSF